MPDVLEMTIVKLINLALIKDKTLHKLVIAIMVRYQFTIYINAVAHELSRSTYTISHYYKCDAETENV